jgi:hypothetical protein
LLVAVGTFDVAIVGGGVQAMRLFDRPLYLKPTARAARFDPFWTLPVGIGPRRHRFRLELGE